MNRQNRGALINLRHILYDIFGNIVVYSGCYIIFDQLGYPLRPVNTLSTTCLYLMLYILFGKSMSVYDVSTFYYPDRIVRNVLSGALLATSGVSMVFFISGRAQWNRNFYLAYFVASALMMLVTSVVSRSIINKRKNNINTLLIGKKEDFARFHSYISKTNIPFHVVGYYGINRSATANENEYIGFFENSNLASVLCEKTIDQVYLMQNFTNQEEIQKSINICSELGVITHIILSMPDTGLSRYVNSVGTYPVMTYHINNLNVIEKALKRIMDIAGALVGIALSIPILLVAAVAIKLETVGPIFFTQTRVGLNGRRFKIYKLRTMTTDAEYRRAQLQELNEIQGGLMFKIKDDPRVTKVGAFLRRTSIDEIPQFFNVLAGHMSLVGTRPPTVDEVNQYLLSHWRRLRSKPGITGLWQISGRSEISTFDEVVALDLQYIEKWTILPDISIILRTIRIVLRGKGAY